MSVVKFVYYFFLLKLKKKDKSQSRFYKYLKNQLKNAPNPSNAAIKHKAGD